MKIYSITFISSGEGPGGGDVFVYNLATLNNAGGKWTYGNGGLINKGTDDWNSFNEVYNGVDLPLTFPADFNINNYTYYSISAEFYGEGKTPIELGWGLGMFNLCSDLSEAGDWGWGTKIYDPDIYNLGMNTSEMSVAELLEAMAGKEVNNVDGILIQSSSDNVRYIKITEIKFFN
jgi:hypothetical protein